MKTMFRTRHTVRLVDTATGETILVTDDPRHANEVMIAARHQGLDTIESR
jgi:hypothetical protein